MFRILILSLIVISSLHSQSESAREKLLMLFSGEWVSRCVYVATKLEIADHLATPKSVEELAGLSSTDPESLYRVMHMLAGFGIFEEVSPRFFANSEASQLLSKANPNSLHALSLFYGEDIHKCWEELQASLQEGVPAFNLAFKQPVFSYFKENAARAALFQDAMKAKSKAVAASAATSYPFGQFQSIYDIGGGQGQFMQALLQLHPQLSCTVFELPEVAAKANVQNIRFIEGDFFKSVPAGGDAYLLKSVLHDWNDEQSEQILKNCHQAMNRDSRLLIVEVVLLPHDKSLYANCMDVLMLTVTGGKERNLDSFKSLLEKSGFELIGVYKTETEFSILEAKKKKTNLQT